MKVGLKLPLIENVDSAEKVPYREAVGALIYLVTCKRPDIALSVGIVSQFMTSHGDAHWSAVKRIYRYLRGTSNLKLQLGGALDQALA